MYFKRWKPSKAAAKEFAETMKEIEIFCQENNISHSKSFDSYYFTINNIEYRVSNHTIEASNAHAYNLIGEQIREKYHDDIRDPSVVYITAGKTRIIQIYEDLNNGVKLNKRGQRIFEK